MSKVTILWLVLLLLTGCGELDDLTDQAEEVEARCNTVLNRIETCLNGAFLTRNPDGSYMLQCV